MSSKRYATLDFETANGKCSSVCSVGIVIVDGGRVVEEFYRLIKPTPNYYSHFTTAVHGLTAADTASAATFPEVWAEIAAKLHGLPIVAHNKTFDEGCLKAVFESFGMPYPNYKFYCTCLYSRRFHKELENHRLNTVAAHCGYDLTNHHHAMADATACYHIIESMYEEMGVETIAELDEIYRSKR